MTARDRLVHASQKLSLALDGVDFDNCLAASPGISNAIVGYQKALSDAALEHVQSLVTANGKVMP